jgi:hypothetical protein
MKITKEWLHNHNACISGQKWFLAQDKSEAVEVINALVVDEKLDWANWTICRVFNKKQKVMYAIFAAEQVIDIFAKKYPDDKRPRLAIEAAKNYLKNPSTKTKNAAAAAADAYATAYAATADAAAAAAAAADVYATADAYAAAAAYATADATAYAAAAYAYATAAAYAYAADAYAAAAARKEMRIKILNYGLSLLHQTVAKRKV